MGRIISIVNQKGGVGKTTTAINLAKSLSMSGKKVLLIDSDPQSNVSVVLGVTQNEFTLYDCLINKIDPIETLCSSNISGLDIIPSNINMMDAEIEMMTIDNRESLMKRMITPLKTFYDYILIDCPPSLGILTINSLTTSDSVIIPLQCNNVVFNGISNLLNTIKIIKNKLNTDLELDGFVLTMYDEKSRLNNQVHSDLKKNFEGLVFKSIINHDKSSLLHDVNSNCFKNYNNLSKELISKHER